MLVNRIKNILMFLLSMSSLICIIEDFVPCMDVMNIHGAFLVWYKIKLNLILIIADKGEIIYIMATQRYYFELEYGYVIGMNIKRKFAL